MVYLLEPRRYKWIQAAYVPDGLMQKQLDGIALQQSDIPLETPLKGSVPIPDICSGAQGFLFVSDRGREVLEDLVPGHIAFFPLTLKAPSRIMTAKAYYFIDVLTRAQLVDWDTTPMEPTSIRTPDGRPTYLTRTASLEANFKTVGADTPPIWRETDVDTPTRRLLINKRLVLMQDHIWQALDERLPKQLVASRFP
ncbi:hypothetical protein BRAO375_2210025 [Bradyrhizobium sp. ORS 375]|uniref:imm11 family protein n=1 Tax=Bradyrhizobium sp. (strain ORS 375) TaxID=566679 RepID=UPI00024090C8|nr:DUF1629 domain-containing protein [Bradyrhizobium sp. ORS 375]CCD92737.1 hypothetical protein BRAO375_2210025 [Bradyrhizobium sp. ORS 375]